MLIAIARRNNKKEVVSILSDFILQSCG